MASPEVQKAPETVAAAPAKPPERPAGFNYEEAVAKTDAAVRQQGLDSVTAANAQLQKAPA